MPHGKPLSHSSGSRWIGIGAKGTLVGAQPGTVRILGHAKIDYSAKSNAETAFRGCEKCYLHCTPTRNTRAQRDPSPASEA
eukprot:2598037-Rhodomonas_salina.2